MKAWLLVLGLLAGQITISLTIHADTVPFPNLVPASLVISYAHDMGDRADVVLKDRKVVYKINSISGDSPSGFVEPTLDQWSKFIEELNAAKVYMWEEHYTGMRIADDGGFYWSIEVQFGERHFASDGKSKLPSDADLKSEPTVSTHVSYNAFNRAVSHLIGHEFP